MLNREDLEKSSIKHDVNIIHQPVMLMFTGINKIHNISNNTN